MLSKGVGKAEIGWRGPWRKVKLDFKLTRSIEGRHDYMDFHIVHRPPSRWMPWR